MVSPRAVWVASALLLINFPRPAVAQKSDPRSLSVLTDALKQDVQKGDLEAAILHHVQIGIAVSPFAGKGQRPSPQAQNWRNTFANLINSLGMQPWLPDDESLTKNFAGPANDIAAATAIGDWDRAQAVLNMISGPMMAAASEASNTISQSDVSRDSVTRAREAMHTAEFRNLMHQFAAEAASDDALKAEPSAALILLELMRLRWEGFPLSDACPVYSAYDVLGRAAFERGDYESALQNLLQSISIPSYSCPKLETKGPSMKLPAALLSKGYTAEVIDYLNRVKPLWKDSPKPDAWIKEIRAGGKPNMAKP